MVTAHRPTGEPWTYWDSADDLAGLLDHLGVERAVVGGMSQGGFVTLRFALKYPERTAGLTPIYRTLMDRDDLTGRLGEIQAPTVLIHGTDDVAIDTSLAEELCRGLVRSMAAATPRT